MGYFSRRRSFLIKLVVVVSTAWFTVAFLLYSESRQPLNTLNAVDAELPNPAALKREVEVKTEARKEEEKNVEDEVPEEVKKEEDQQGVLKMPQSEYGEMGKPVVLPKNLSVDIKKVVDEGWSKNAFNQYASDLISVRRSLPDPRDDW